MIIIPDIILDTSETRSPIFSIMVMIIILRSPVGYLGFGIERSFETLYAFNTAGNFFSHTTYLV